MTNSKLDQFIDAARAEGLDLPEAQRLLHQRHEQRELLAGAQEIAALAPRLPDTQWRALKSALRTRRQDLPQRRDVMLDRMAAAFRSDNQSEFWAAVLLLAAMARAEMPHKDKDFEISAQDAMS